MSDTTKDKLDTLLALGAVIVPFALFLIGAFSDDPQRFFSSVLALPLVGIAVAGVAVIPFLLFAAIFRR